MAESTTTLLDILKINSTAAKKYIANKLSTYAVKTDVETSLSNKQDKLTFDTTPIADSANPVTSGGIKTAIDSISVPEFTQTEIDECITAAGLTLNNADMKAY